MAIIHFLFYGLLFFSCYHPNKPYEVEATKMLKHHHVIKVRSLIPASTCSSSATGPKPQLGKIKLSHRYGPCSPLHQESTSHPSSHQILLQDESRVISINARMTNSVEEYGDETRLLLFDRSIGAGDLVVTVGLGTPKIDYTLIFDTGSGITWVQCQPCSVSCYPQQDPLYSPSNSSTYSPAQCTSSNCDYSISYADKSFSKGRFERDTLTLTPSDVFPNFIFGCGQENRGNFGSAAGMLGIGSDQDRLSLISQTYSEYALVFCYCLPAAESSTGYLLFGFEALRICQTQNYVPLIKDPHFPSFYFVKVVSLSLDGKTLMNISSFRTIIDSGTIITRLPMPVYSVLRAAFRQSMSLYPSAPALPPLMDTCYNLEGLSDVRIPSIELVFEKSVKVNLDPSGIIWRESDAQVCLAFAGNSNSKDLTIIGNHQQKTLNILYDIQSDRVEISKGNC